MRDYIDCDPMQAGYDAALERRPRWVPKGISRKPRHIAGELRKSDAEAWLEGYDQAVAEEEMRRQQRNALIRLRKRIANRR